MVYNDISQHYIVTVFLFFLVRDKKIGLSDLRRHGITSQKHWVF